MTNPNNILPNNSNNNKIKQKYTINTHAINKISNHQKPEIDINHIVSLHVKIRIYPLMR
jgi:hypothetical protein